MKDGMEEKKRRRETVVSNRERKGKTYPSKKIYPFLFCVLFYIHNHLLVFFFKVSCFTNLLDTFVTVPIDVRRILLMM